MPIERLRLSTSARLSALFALLLVGALLVAGTITYFATAHSVENAIRERIALDMQAMEFEIEHEGTEGLLPAIRARADRPGALNYRLESRDGALVLDDLRGARPGVGWVRMQGGDTQTLLVLTRQLPDGSLLSIADDLRQAEAARRAVLWALGWSGVLALLVGFGAASWTTRRSLARMELVSQAVSGFAGGDHTLRAPRSGGRVRDDIDTIAEGVNTILDTVATLAASVRRVSVAVAHDLRTPLSHIRQKLDSVGDEHATPAQRAGEVIAVQGEIDEIMRTFDAILSLSEIESASAADGFEILDLAQVVENIASAYSADIEAGGRRLKLQSAGSVPVRGNRYLLGRALANLLENAARHTPQGTVIGIGVSAELQGARLCVSDNGPGIPESERAAALEPFYRLDRSRSTRGCGLGLAIVAAIARHHRARLTLGDAQPGLRVSLVFGSQGASATSAKRISLA